jgi:hypothetical protein
MSRRRQKVRSNGALDEIGRDQLEIRAALAAEFIQ